MEALNKNILLRDEFFGGILINKSNFERQQLNKSETILLKALSEVQDLKKAEQIHDMIISNREYDINRLIEMGIIIVDDTYIEQENNVELIANKLKERLEEVQGYKFLSGPLELIIYPTLKCNLNCKFCFLKNKTASEFGSERWLKIISEAKEMGALSVSVLGGEPALYEEIDELLSGIESLGIKTTMTTNGIKLKESTKEILVRSKYITPVISLQCLSEKNNELMGADYKKQVEVIDYFVKNNKTVRVNSVYTNQTIEEFYEMIDFVANNGIDRYSIGTYVKTNDKNTILQTRTLLDSRMLSEKLQSYIKDKYKDKRINYSVEGCLLYSAYPEIEHEIGEMCEFDKLYYGCRAARSKLEIYSNGDVYPCIFFENQMKPTSNVLQDTLKNIWKQDSTLNMLRNQRVSNEKCNKCGFNVFCNGGCPVTKQKQYGELWNEHKDPNCCMYKENTEKEKDQ